jgi:membrane carboxypeptidase/penicillin-binding protein
VKPRGIVSVTDASGDEVYHVHVDRERVLPETTAFQMVSILRDVVARGTGAGVRAYGVRGDIAGKTGTTNDYRDAWFVGFSSSVVAGVWVGFDRPESIRAGASGARAALPIWAGFMRRTSRRLPSQSFVAPAGLRPVEMCRLSYHRALDECPTYTEYFKEGDEIPAALCPLHSGNLKQEARRVVQGLLRALWRGFKGEERPSKRGD